jgi:chromatin remodeling complex protein RSC6
MSAPTESSHAQIDAHFKELYTQLNTFSKQARSIQDDLKSLQRATKAADKTIRAKKRRPQEKLNISASLSKFLGVESSAQLSKAEVMKQISSYIKEKNLQNAADRRRFKPNKELCKIFNVTKPTNITFVEINKLVSHHMTK